MRALPSAGRSTVSAEAAEELAGTTATCSGARSLGAGWLSLPGAASAGERR